MRKLLAWLLAALLAGSGLCLAEAPTPQATMQVADAVPASANGSDAVRLGSEVYFVIPEGSGEMLVRLPLEGGEPTCIDRGEDIGDLLPFADGLVYLKGQNGATTIQSCSGDELSTVYSFGASAAGELCAYQGKLLVLIDGLLHSIEPASQLCLRLSSSRMLEYVVSGDSAYFLSGGDRMEYTANLENGETVSTQAGCIYSLDLNSGETMLLLKSGGTDLQISGGTLYFHNLANAYALRNGDSTQLLGRVGSLDVQLREEVVEVCPEADNGFWCLADGTVVWYDNALNITRETGEVSLYSPESGATVVGDGVDLYVWESGKQSVTRVQTNGTQTRLYTGDLTAASELGVGIVPEQTPEAGADADPNADDAWYDDYMDDAGGDSGSSGWPQATPIGQTPTPRPGTTPSATAAPVPPADSYTGDSYSTGVRTLVTTADVHMRSGPGTDYAIQTTLLRGVRVSCTGRAATGTGGGTWYQVTYNGMTGWIYSGYTGSGSSGSSGNSGSSGSSGGPGAISSASGTRYTVGSVNLRTGPGLNFASRSTIPSGTKLKITAKSLDSRGVTWFKTTYKKTTGWVSARYLSKSKPSGGGSAGKKSVTTTGQVTIRKSANKGSRALGYIGAGKTVPYLGKSSTDSRGVRWFKVNYNGIIGWVSSRYSYLS